MLKNKKIKRINKEREEKRRGVQLLPFQINREHCQNP
jgi:hypothetical protein